MPTKMELDHVECERFIVWNFHAPFFFLFSFFHRENKSFPNRAWIVQSEKKKNEKKI